MNTNIPTSLPDAIDRYFDAANRFDAAAAAACFTPDALVRDEHQDYIGTAAIESWVSQTGEKYQPRATVTGVREKGEKLALTVNVAGQFPGSPVELEFEFHLRDGKIARLTIQ